LRERVEDIPLLIQHFLAQLNAAHGKQVKKVHEATLAHLMRYTWPGNVRELQHALTYAIIRTNHPVLTLEDFPKEVQQEPVPQSWAARSYGNPETERRQIEEALQATRGRKREAAKRLGMSRTTLWKKLKTYRQPYP